MTKDQALSLVASTFAVEVADHAYVLKKIPHLQENSEGAAQKYRDAAKVLGIEELYNQKLAIHMAGLWHLLPNA